MTHHIFFIFSILFDIFFRSVWLISPSRFQFTEVVEVTFTCAFNYTAFPFDEQVFYFRILIFYLVYQRSRQFLALFTLDIFAHNIAIIETARHSLSERWPPAGLGKGMLNKLEMIKLGWTYL